MRIVRVEWSVFIPGLLHFLSSAVVGLLAALLMQTILLKFFKLERLSHNKQLEAENIIFSISWRFALFCSVALHLFIDYIRWW